MENKKEIEFEYTIAIDNPGTKFFEQTYSYDSEKKCVWMHLVTLTQYYDLTQQENQNLEEIKKFLVAFKIKKSPFENKKQEYCISVPIFENKSYQENLENKLYFSKVKLTSVYTFDESDNILINRVHGQVNDKQRQDYEIINKLHDIVTSLLLVHTTGSKKITHMDNTDSFTMSSEIISQLSIFFSARIGHHMFDPSNQFFKDFDEIRLFVSEYSSNDVDITKLKALFEECFSTCAFYSDLIQRRYHTFKANNFLSEEDVKSLNSIPPNTDGIEILKNSLDRLKKNLNSHKLEKVDIIKIANKRIWPQFNYYEHLVREYRPNDSACYQFFSIKEYAPKKDNLINFDINSMLHSKLTEIFNDTWKENKKESIRSVDPWNFIYLNLVYVSIQPQIAQNVSLDYFKKEILNYKINQRKMKEQRQSINKKDNTNKTKIKFEGTKSIYSLIIKCFRAIPDNELIISFKFPHIQTFYRLPINNYLNLSRIFQKWNPKIEDNNHFEVTFKINYSDQFKKEEYPDCEIESESWKRKISIDSFKRLYNFSYFSQANDIDEFFYINKNCLFNSYTCR